MTQKSIMSIKINHTQKSVSETIKLLTNQWVESMERDGIKNENIKRISSLSVPFMISFLKIAFQNSTLFKHVLSEVDDLKMVQNAGVCSIDDVFCSLTMISSDCSSFLIQKIECKREWEKEDLQDAVISVDGSRFKELIRKYNCDYSPISRYCQLIKLIHDVGEISIYLYEETEKWIESEEKLQPTSGLIKWADALKKSIEKLSSQDTDVSKFFSKIFDKLIVVDPTGEVTDEVEKKNNYNLNLITDFSVWITELIYRETNMFYTLGEKQNFIAMFQDSGIDILTKIQVQSEDDFYQEADKIFANEKENKLFGINSDEEHIDDENNIIYATLPTELTTEKAQKMIDVFIERGYVMIRDDGYYLWTRQQGSMALFAKYASEYLNLKPQNGGDICWTPFENSFYWFNKKGEEVKVKGLSAVYHGTNPDDSIIIDNIFKKLKNNQ